MSNYPQDGEYISLVWNGTPDALYIKGHIQQEMGILILEDEDATLTGFWENGKFIDCEFELGDAEHIYGRWSMEPREDGISHIFREYKTPGRGRFKITKFPILGKTKQCKISRDV